MWEFYIIFIIGLLVICRKQLGFVNRKVYQTGELQTFLICIFVHLKPANFHLLIFNFYLQFSRQCFKDLVKRRSAQCLLIIWGGVALILMFKVIQFGNDRLFRSWLKFFCRNSVIIGVLRCTEALKSQFSLTHRPFYHQDEVVVVF